MNHKWTVGQTAYGWTPETPETPETRWVAARPEQITEVAVSKVGRKYVYTKSGTCEECAFDAQTGKTKDYSADFGYLFPTREAIEAHKAEQAELEMRRDLAHKLNTKKSHLAERQPLPLATLELFKAAWIAAGWWKDEA